MQSKVGLSSDAFKGWIGRLFDYLELQSNARLSKVGFSSNTLSNAKLSKTKLPSVAFSSTKRSKIGLSDCQNCNQTLDYEKLLKADFQIVHFQMLDCQKLDCQVLHCQADQTLNCQALQSKVSCQRSLDWEIAWIVMSCIVKHKLSCFLMSISHSIWTIFTNN